MDSRRQDSRHDVTLGRAILPLLASLFLFLAAAPASHGQEGVPILVQVILASNTGHGFEPPALARIVKLLGSPYNKYSSYRLVKSQRLVLPPQRSGLVTLPGNRVLVVTPLSATAGAAQIEASIKGYIRSKFFLRRGATQFIGGLSEPGGDLLIAITLE
jgi:hypothetical protein